MGRGFRIPSGPRGQLSGGYCAEAGGVYRRRRRTLSRSTPSSSLARSAARISTPALARGPGLAPGVAVGNRRVRRGGRSPRLPQIRTCANNAFCSSRHRLAAGRDVAWTGTAAGSDGEWRVQSSGDTSGREMSRAGRQLTGARVRGGSPPSPDDQAASASSRGLGLAASLPGGDQTLGNQGRPHGDGRRDQGGVSNRRAQDLRRSRPSGLPPHVRLQPGLDSAAAAPAPASATALACRRPGT
jgi:hypothetical protein